MQRKKWGKIINIASLQSVRAFPNSALRRFQGRGDAADACHGGSMVQATRAASPATLSGRVFSRPGSPPLYNDQKVIDALARQTIIGRNGDLSDLAGLTMFLASRASDYITGQPSF
jgi:NAD(P)-dependent dehydrogenase (short-subunit alcohol dehydrogenase family)